MPANMHVAVKRRDDIVSPQPPRMLTPHPMLSERYMSKGPFLYKSKNLPYNLPIDYDMDVIEREQPFLSKSVN